MKLSQATSKFNDTPFDGLTTTGIWKPQLVHGALQVYDRFISNKTFGNKKRILMIGALNPDIPEGITHLRAPDGNVFLLAARNHDIGKEGVYAAVYMITECAFQCRIEKTARAQNEHGLPATAVQTLSDPIYCDMEDYSSARSTEFPAVVYSVFSFSLPLHIDVTSDDRILVGETAYDVKEVSPLLLTKVVAATELGTP